MTRVTEALPPEITETPDLTEILVKTGSRRLVFLEGDDDVAVYNEWFMDRRAEVYFHFPGGGNTGVINYVKLAQDTGVSHSYGIIDRDFRSDDEIEACLNEPTSRLFILRRYCIENYLIEPNAICEELRVYYGTRFPIPDVNTMQSDLLGMSQQLGVVMAANQTLRDGAGEFLSVGFEIHNRALIVQQVAGRLNISTTEAEQRITKIEVLLAPRLTTLESAHTCINGKLLLHEIYKKYVVNVRGGWRKDYLFRLLVRTIKQQGVHADIRTIIEDKILK